MKKPYNRLCPVCNREIWGVKNAHHVFGGNKILKQRSEEDMFLVNLHPECHILLHSTPKVEQDLKAKCQSWYEKEGHTREQFIERYKRNYIDD